MIPFLYQRSAIISQRCLLCVASIRRKRAPSSALAATFEELTVISRYTDHAANERTFLAWVRTGIATIAFGFVIEKFNLFVLTLAATSSPEAGLRLQLERV